jgi:SulP family sulfate permease
MAGAILVLLGLFRLGNLIKYIPHTITVGFTSGIAVTLFVGQMKDFLGLTYPSGTHAIETLEKLSLVFEHISTINVYAVLIGVVSLAILIFVPKILKKLPPSLIAVIVGALIVALLPIDVATVGSLYTIEAGLPTISVPEFSIDKVIALIPSAVTIALLASIESLLSCVVSDKMVGDTHNPNTELIALGLGNVFVGFCGGIPATGAIARTAANVKNGAKSPLSGMTHALVLLLVLVVLMPLASMIPMPVIASILFVVAYNMSEYREFFAIIKSKQVTDIIVLVLTFVLTVVFDLVVAIVAGIVLHYLIKLIKSKVAK